MTLEQVSVVPATVYYQLNHTALEPKSLCLQLADQSVRYPLGITENILVKIREFFMLVDFVVLDMHPESKVSLILERPFLSTANAYIDVAKKSNSHSSQNKSSILLQRW
jgi:hypothetical protein